MDLGEIIGRFIAGLIVTFVGTGVTLAIADGAAHQHWAFWPVLGAWACLVFLGFVVFEINDGDFDLF